MSLNQNYMIQNVGTMEWTAYGASNPAIVGSQFVYTLNAPNLAPACSFAMQLDTNFFLANANYYTPPTNGLPFSLTYNSNFNCLITVDGGGLYTSNACTGTGGWLLISGGVWNIPPSAFPQPYSTMAVGNLIIHTTAVTMINTTVPVTNLIPTFNYYIATIGNSDNSNFLWNNVTNSFPITLSNEEQVTGQWLYNLGISNGIQKNCFFDVTRMGAPDTKPSTYFQVGSLTSIPYSNPVNLGYNHQTGLYTPSTMTNANSNVGSPGIRYIPFSEIYLFQIQIAPDEYNLAEILYGNIEQYRSYIVYSCSEGGSSCENWDMENGALLTIGKDVLYSVNDLQWTAPAASTTVVNLAQVLKPINYTICFPYPYQFLANIQIGAPFTALGPWIQTGPLSTATASWTVGNMAGYSISSTATPNYIGGTVSPIS